MSKRFCLWLGRRHIVMVWEWQRKLRKMNCRSSACKNHWSDWETLEIEWLFGTYLVCVWHGRWKFKSRKQILKGFCLHWRIYCNDSIKCVQMKHGKSIEVSNQNVFKRGHIQLRTHQKKRTRHPERTAKCSMLNSRTRQRLPHNGLQQIVWKEYGEAFPKFSAERISIFFDKSASVLNCWALATYLGSAVQLVLHNSYNQSPVKCKQCLAVFSWFIWWQNSKVLKTHLYRWNVYLIDSL